MSELSTSRRASRWSGFGLAASLPWCCLLPAALSFAGAASAVGARLWISQATPLFLAVSVLALGRAHYLIWVRRHGPRWSRSVVVGATIVSAAIWLHRGFG